VWQKDEQSERLGEVVRREIMLMLKEKNTNMTNSRSAHLVARPTFVNPNRHDLKSFYKIPEKLTDT